MEKRRKEYGDLLVKVPLVTLGSVPLDPLPALFRAVSSDSARDIAVRCVGGGNGAVHALTDGIFIPFWRSSGQNLQDDNGNSSFHCFSN